MADALGLREGTELKPKIKNMFIFNPKLGNKEGRVSILNVSFMCVWL